jgi:hypothetical protein
VSATLRGFYDDNINTTPSGGNRVGSFGLEVSPSVSVDLALEQTLIVASYTYALTYYEKRPQGNSGNYDQDHTFNVEIDHAFSERYRLNVGDSFVIGQQPDTLRVGNAFSTPYRVSGDNIVNSGSITLDAQMTPVFSIEAGYVNALYSYADHQYSIVPGIVAPSNAGSSDRIEQTAHLEGHWNVMPQTVGIIGCQYGQVDYTGGQPVAMSDTGAIVFSDSRNDRSYGAYIGADHSFLPDLSGSIRVGAQYYDYYNDLNNASSFGPTAQASLQYLYSPDSYLQFGFQQGRNATDLTGQSGNDFIHDQEVSVVYGSIRHRIVPHLYGSVTGSFQYATFNGGGPVYDGKSEKYYLLGLDLEYRFNPHLSANAGYDYDRFDSEVAGRSYDRNKVYMGITASY